MIKTIGLLSPYGGDNLGDGAIQEALIQNISTRIPDVQIVGLNLYPIRAEKLHGIPCYPISLFQLPYYAVTLSENSEPVKNVERANPVSFRYQIKETLKKLPLFYRLLKTVQCVIERSRVDMRHSLQAYAITRKLDALIVAGGGQLDDYWGGAWGHPYTLFKWCFIAKITQRPFLVFSVGTCSLKSPLSRFFAHWALRLATYRSYRDVTSKELLSDMKFTHDDKVFPDLAFSYSRAPQRRQAISPTRVVGLSPISFLSPHYWPEQDDHIYSRYVALIKAFAMYLIDRGYSIVFFATASPDEKSIQEILRHLGDDLKRIDGRISAPATGSVHELFCVLSQIDYVVTSRLHGAILSHLNLIPVAAISYDRKVNTYMDDVQQSRYCLDIATITLSTLIEVFHHLETNRESVASLLKDKTNQYKIDLGRQYDLLLHRRPKYTP